MRIYLNNRIVKYENNDRVISFENDSDVIEFVCVVEDSSPFPDKNWKYKLDIEAKTDSGTFHNTISLKEDKLTGLHSVLLKAGMMPRGKCIAQIRRIDSDATYVSECFEIWVKKSVLGFCNAYQEQEFIPSEFYQIEQTLEQVTNNPPIPDKSGFWRVWDTEAGEYVISDIRVINQNIYLAGKGLNLNIDTGEFSVNADYNTISIDGNGKLYVDVIDGGVI